LLRISKPRVYVNVCIMMSLDYSFCLMHMFELFEFELNSIEKTNRKVISKFRKMEKPNSALTAQLGPVSRARVRSPDRWDPPISASLHPRALPPSLPLPGGADLSASTPLKCGPRSLSVPWAPLVSAANHSPCTLSVHRGQTLSALSSPQPSLTHMCTHANRTNHVAFPRAPTPF
jgi:hypothetical protein